MERSLGAGGDAMSGKAPRIACLCAAIASVLITTAGESRAQKIYLNPSDQTDNAVAGGGTEAQYALINANLTKPILDAAGFTARVDQDFYNSPANANSWGADIFVSIHSNAGGGHGTETLWVSSSGEVLAGHVQDGLLSWLPYQDRGLKYRDDLHVLNATSMTAVLTETLFHDCASDSGYQGHPPSESAFLRSADGEQKIAMGIARGICTHFSKTCAAEPVAQKGWLKGVVYRAPNLDDVIDGASVALQTGQTYTTASDGAFSFELDPGTYTLTASKPGFQSGTVTRDVVAGQDVWGSVGLEADAPVQDAGPEAAVEPDADVAWDAWPAVDSAVDGPAATWAASSAEPSGCACGVSSRAGNDAAWYWVAAASVLASARRRKRNAPDPLRL